MWKVSSTFVIIIDDYEVVVISFFVMVSDPQVSIYKYIIIVEGVMIICAF